MDAKVNGITLRLLQGDITDLAVDAIVNAANSQLILGSGVAGAIRRKGGPGIQAECLAIGWCDVGDAVITGAGNLPARHVIHAVGPRMGEGHEPGKLEAATRASLTLAEQQRLASIALPAISTGIFGFPLEACAEIMLRVAIDFTFEEIERVRLIIFCLYDRHAFEVFVREFRQQLAKLADET
ncbi:MAG: macro domain-containing protein [Anaerolineae bacterium]|nr:macro domain-containing protein [Anaerolineae bacterium]